MSDWQPIETAPKDGTRFLLCMASGVVWNGYYRVGREPGTREDAEWAKPGWTRVNCCDVGLHPTHWMPLPPPPQNDLTHLADATPKTQSKERAET